MQAFIQTIHNKLYFDGISLEDIAAQFGTPCYIYSQNIIDSAISSFKTGFQNIPQLSVCYAVKANSNIHILKRLAKHGLGFDLVSGGELYRVLQAGADSNKIVFSGVGKSKEEIAYALQSQIACLNVESIAELYRIQEVAQELNTKAPIAFRVNPEIDAQTHPYISTALKNSKFGLPFDEARKAYELAKTMSHIQIEGVAYHVGSQILNISPLVEALKLVLRFVDELEQSGIKLNHIDIGGGFGIQYDQEHPFDLASYAKTVAELLGPRKHNIMIEPGRALVGNAGILLTRVEYLKHNGSHDFAIVDAGMNDLIRPSLYEAWHNIKPVCIHEDIQAKIYDIVGPVCESADFLGLSRKLAIQQGDLLAVCSAGAYGFSMSSNYNSRPRPVEVLIENGELVEIRRRESMEDLLRAEV